MLNIGTFNPQGMGGAIIWDVEDMVVYLIAQFAGEGEEG